MTSFRFVHAADIHLDSPLKGLAGQEGSAADLIRSATRKAFEALVDRTIEDQAAFLIIAGDLYDGDWKDYQTGQFFIRQMGRLNERRIPAFLIYGNHDAQSQITKRLTLPGNVKVFSATKPETFSIAELGISLHGQSFKTRDVTDNLARSYPAPVSGALNIGVLHTGLSGEEGHAKYAPCSLDELVNKGYDYWALGHIHKPGFRNERPWVVYAGIPQGRHINESGPKGAVLVTVEDGSIETVERFDVDVVRWALVEVSAEGCDSLESVQDRIGRSIERAVDEGADDRLLACRIEIKGRVPIHGKLVASKEHLFEEARAATLGLGTDRAWIERLVISTEPSRAAGPDPAWEPLIESIKTAAADEALVSQLKSDIGALISKLPPEVRDDQEAAFVRAAADGDIARLIELASPEIIDRLEREVS